MDEGAMGVNEGPMGFNMGVSEGDMGGRVLSSSHRFCLAAAAMTTFYRTNGCSSVSIIRTSVGRSSLSFTGP